MTNNSVETSIPFKHNESCPLSGKHYSSWDNPKGTCDAYNYQDWLPHIAPDFFWFDIQDVGSYQGQVYGVAVYNKQIAIYEDYYGSCSGCGAWGEGGEPTSQDEVIKLCKFFNTKDEAILYCTKMDSYEKPDMDIFVKAVQNADTFLNTEVQA